jgi:iron complex outermembrane receptor protein
MVFSVRMTRSQLICGVAFAALATSSALAQDKPAPAASATANQDVLGEVVVTATRQTSTVNKVPLSITAVTQSDMDKTGLKSLEDLSRQVPSITFRKASDGGESIAIRGLSSVLGAPTTAIYLDDTPLQKRDVTGAATGNGAPLAPLFDLERVEVLRGPQGTLFGGSAEGGAVRFISPSPSLTKYSAYARAEVAQTQGGTPSYETGLAVGGPIIQDKLGFRVSAWGRFDGGYMDHVSIYTAKTIANNTNNTITGTVRAALTWAPTSNLLVTPAFYWTQKHDDDAEVFTENIPQYKINSGYFTNKGTINGVSYAFPGTFFQGGTYGPFNQFGPFKIASNIYFNTTGNEQAAYAPRTQSIALPTLTVDYKFGDIAVKSITSVLRDTTVGYANPGSFGLRTAVLPITTSSTFLTGPGGTPVPGGVGAQPAFFPGFPTTYNELHYDQVRQAETEEIRISSAPSGSRLSWVGGVYAADSITHSGSYTTASEGELFQFLRGFDESWLLGNTQFANGDYSARFIHIRESDLAAFGEANYLITDKLKVTAGMRVTRNSISYFQETGGSVPGAPPGFVGTPGPPAVITNPNQPNHAFPNQPGDNPYTMFSGTQTSTPVNPKFGLNYQLTENDLVYATASKGFRAGGLNAPSSPTACAPDLAALGLTGVGTPLTYAPDSVWSYEAGAKLKLLDNRMQLNSSIFYIDWKDPQFNVKLKCNATYTLNGGAAVSKGADVQARGRLFGVILGASLSYTDARYTKPVIIPGLAGSAPSVFAKQGEPLGSPDWQYSLSAEYDFRIYDQWDTYVVGDYQYSSPYQRGSGPGDVGYDAVVAKGAQTHFGDLRAGLRLKGADLSLFVKNVTNSQDRLYQSHTAGSTIITSTTFRPRTVGVTATYRY